MNAFRRCLEAADYAGLRIVWARVFPHLDPLRDDRSARLALHHARTQSQSIPLAKRLYSHAWLDERGLPSGLPDELRPQPRNQIIVEAVGVSVRPRDRSAEHVERAAEMEAVMAAAAAEAYADGVTDPKLVSARMWEARDRIAGI